MTSLGLSLISVQSWCCSNLNLEHPLKAHILKSSFPVHSAIAGDGTCKSQNLMGGILVIHRSSLWGILRSWTFIVSLCFPNAMRWVLLPSGQSCMRYCLAAIPKSMIANKLHGPESPETCSNQAFLFWIGHLGYFVPVFGIVADTVAQGSWSQSLWPPKQAPW